VPFVSDCRSDASRDRENAAIAEVSSWLRFRGRDSRRSYRGRAAVAFVVVSLQAMNDEDPPQALAPGRSGDGRTA